MDNTDETPGFLAWWKSHSGTSGKNWPEYRLAKHAWNLGREEAFADAEKMGEVELFARNRQQETGK